MRVHARVTAVVAAVTLFVVPGVAWGAELPRGPVTAETVAAAQAEATSAATAATEAARAAAEAGVALDAAKAAAQTAADKAAATNDPADIAAAAAASAAQATAQQNFDAKTAAAAKASADSTTAEANAAREAASFAKLSRGTSAEGTPLPDDTVLPDSEHSANVEFVAHARGPVAVNGNCPAYNPSKCPAFSALNFLHYENLGYDVLVANGTPGLGVWSLKDPAHPQYISSISAAQIGAVTGENLTQFWEGENMTVDSRRKLAYLSKDSGRKGIVIVDVKDPWHPVLVGFQPTPLGHTATCLNDCRFIWQVGGGVSGRRSAVAVTDIRDIEHPFTYSNVFEAAVRRTSSTSGSTHSVDVDFDGVAWVSGSGGVRGWWTEGEHMDTATGQMRMATPYDPLPYGGGSVAGANAGAFMHNAYHVPQALGDQKAGDVMLITNEANSTRCQNAGQFIIASLDGVRDVEDNLPFAATTTPKQMTQLASYRTFGKPGEFIDNTRAIGDCSAHWFSVKGNIVALGNYEQGTRFIDISDPRNPEQVGYFRVPARAAEGSSPAVISSNVASAIWHGKYVYVSDYARGIDVLKFTAPKGTTQPKTCWNSCVDTQTMGDWDDAPGSAGGSVPATLSLTMGAPATFGAFTPGVAKEYTASTTATVISTAGDATLTVADNGPNPGFLVNGAFKLAQPLQGLGVVKAYSGPASNDVATVTLKQAIGAGDALRTGSYSKTLTFTLSTTNP
jgi:hypothetical protein